MRILIVSQYFWPENFRLNDLVVELVERGHEVTVLTGPPNYPSGNIFAEFKKDRAAFNSFSGASVIRIPLLPRGQSAFRLVLNYLSFVLSGLTFGAWRLRGRSFDAIFVYQVSPITAALPALWFRRLKRAPLFIWVLDLWPETLLAVGAIRSPIILRCVGRLVAYIYRRCDRILVQSKAFIPNVQKHSGELARILYFPGWAEPIFQDPLANVKIAPELASYEGKFKVLFAGNIGDAQDFPAILDAAEALRDRSDMRWIIVGDGRAAGNLKAEIARRGLREQVITLGRFPVERMPSLFRAADALLVTLRKDAVFSLTIPAKVQSYLGAGVPILGMLDGEGARVIEESGAGIVCPAGEGRELAKKVVALMEMPVQDRAMMGTRGKDYCSRMFDRSKLVTMLEMWMDSARTEALADRPPIA